MIQKIPQAIESDNNGYNAWLNYQELSSIERLCEYRRYLTSVNGDASPEILRELRGSLLKIAGIEIAESTNSTSGIHLIRDDDSPQESYGIHETNGRIEIRGAGVGLLYGTYRFIRHLMLGLPLENLHITSEPYYAVRMLNHWDDPKFDHTLGPFNVTRGFAGNSIFNWDDLSEENPRYIDYARLLASTGINATCINNVNADPDLLETSYLPNIASLADRLRPYGIKVYLAVCFSAPMVTDGELGKEEYGMDYPFCMRNRKIRLGCLDTADPRDPRVQKWWGEKVKEIYSLIPDFGGFVVKANSEGMPGPQVYGQTHADGANLIARALKPHGGTIFWRSFVHAAISDRPKTDPWGDGACGPYLEFEPLDGEFDDNVILQTKNGPGDFRADEPPSPLLGSVPKTAQAVEFMIAQEYLGHTTHIAYQAHHWQSILNFDTYKQGAGSTVAAVTAGRHGTYKAGAITAVANIGDDPNWFGHLFAGANAYAFGRLAWNPADSPAQIAKDWSRLTINADEEVHETVTEILNESYSTFARYAAPLGLGYMHESAHHYEPQNQKLGPRAWSEKHAGLDRTLSTGSQYLGQYTPQAASRFENPAVCPVNQLLFFHELPWDYIMPDGRSLAQYIAEDRIEAVGVVHGWMEKWKLLIAKVDPLTWAHIYERMHRQYFHAGKWRDEGLKALERVGQHHTS